MIKSYGKMMILLNNDCSQGGIMNVYTKKIKR